MSAPNPQSTLAASPSWLARIAVVLVFLAPLAPTLHLAGSAHHLCDEHGEIEHGDAHAATHAAVDVAPDSATAAEGDTANSHAEHDALEVASVEAEHEHCEAVGLLRVALDVSPTATPIALLAAPDAVARVLAPIVRAGPPLLDLAPKAGPPARA